MPSSRGAHAETVGADHAWVEAVGGEVGIGEDDFIAMAHFGEDLEEFGADSGVDTFEHVRSVGKFCVRCKQRLLEAVQSALVESASVVQMNDFAFAGDFISKK